MKSGSHFGVTPEYKWWQGLPIVSEASEHASSTLPETLPDMMDSLATCYEVRISVRKRLSISFTYPRLRGT